jgi:hypothetical protein
MLDALSVYGRASVFKNTSGGAGVKLMLLVGVETDKGLVFKTTIYASTLTHVTRRSLLPRAFLGIWR